MQETLVRSLGQENPLEKKMVTHSIILAWEIPWTVAHSGLQSMGLQRVRHKLATKTTTVIYGRKTCSTPDKTCSTSDTPLWS